MEGRAKRYRLFGIVVAAVLAMPALAVPALASATAAIPAITSSSGGVDLTNVAYDTLCIRDPSGGGPGTEVVVSFCTDSAAEDWSFYEYPSDYCPNASITQSCPGGPISADYFGGELVTLRNNAQGNSACLHANDSTHWIVAMQASCGDASSTFAVLGDPNHPGSLFFVSVKYNNENNCRGYLYPSGSGNNDALIIGDTCADPGIHTDWLWGLS